MNESPIKPPKTSDGQHDVSVRLCPTVLMAISGLLLANGLASCTGGPVTPQAQVTAASVAYRWIELGPEGRILARVITAVNGACPTVELDGEGYPMNPRATAPPPGFETVRVCEYTIPAGTASATVDGQPLALPPPAPQKIVVVGDTGCRVKGTDIQNCTGVDADRLGPAWNFAQVAQSIRAVEPDLIIHVGDFHYRETGSCDARCDQNNIGYTWASWEADFFGPAAPVLSQAPWVFIRGNHEDCGTDAATGRAWRGWFYFLDPHDLPDAPWQWENCQDYTDPYTVSAGDQTLVVMDTSEIPDDYAATPDPMAVAHYAREFTMVDGLVADSSSAWLATHRPVWAVASYLMNNAPEIAFTDLTLQTALANSDNGRFPETIAMLIAGHVHQFEMLTFTDGRPPQLVFGGGATKLDPEITDAVLAANPSVLQELGVTRSNFTSIHNIDFGVIESNDDGWRVTIKDAGGEDEEIYLVRSN